MRQLRHLHGLRFRQLAGIILRTWQGNIFSQNKTNIVVCNRRLEVNVLTLLRHDGVSVQIAEKQVTRIRQSVASLGEAGNSRIDGPHYPFYLDHPADVAAAVKEQIASFISLRQPAGQPVWFDGAKAEGPLFVNSYDSRPTPGGQARSAVKIAGKLQYVNDTPEAVFAAIQGQGGAAIPPIRTGNAAGALSGEAEPEETLEIWDALLYLDPSTVPTT